MIHGITLIGWWNRWRILDIMKWIRKRTVSDSLLDSSSSDSSEGVVEEISIFSCFLFRWVVRDLGFVFVDDLVVEEETVRRGLFPK